MGSPFVIKPLILLPEEPSIEPQRVDPNLDRNSPGKKVSKAFPESEYLFQATLDAIGDIIHIIDKEYRIIYHNENHRKYMEMLGLDPEISGKYLFDAFPFITENTKKSYERVFLTGESVLREEKVEYDWGTVQSETRKYPIVVEGTVVGIITLIRDITAQKNTEKALQDSEELSRTTLEAIGDMLHVIDCDYKILLHNSRHVSYFEQIGLDPHIDGRYWDEVFPFLPSRVKKEYEIIFETGQPLFTEEVSKIANRDIYTETRKFPIFEEGRVVRVLTIVRDITAQKEAERALQESEEKYRSLFENAQMGVGIVSKSGKILEINEAMSQMFGGSTEELNRVGGIKDLYLDAMDWQKIIEQIQQKGRVDNYELPLRSLQGKEYWAIVSTRPIIYEGQEAYLTTQVDITARKQMEKALVQGEEKLRYRIRLEQLVSTVARELTGTTAHDLTSDIPRTLGTIGEFFHAGRVSINRFTENFETILRLSEWWASGQEKIPRHSSVKVKPIPSMVELSEGHIQYFPALENLSEHLPENRILKAMGAKSIIMIPFLLGNQVSGVLSLEWFDQPTSLHDEDFAMLQILGEILAGVIHQKQLEEQLELRQKMDYLSTLIGGIAHDFNNLLTGIIGNLSLLNMELENLSKPQQDNLKDAENSCALAATLIKQLQAFSRDSRVDEMGLVDLHDTLQETFAILEKTTDPLIKRILKIPPDTFFVEGKPADFLQIFLNLSSNSVHAITAKGLEHGDAIRVEANAQEVNNFDNSTDIAPGPYVHIRFSDTGIGMSPDIQENAFIPFFSTRNKGTRKGQGLGLAMVYHLVTKKYGGSVDIESELGKGTVFHMYLPLVLKKPEPNRHSDSLPKVQSGETKVLIVDDERMIRVLLERVLRRGGYDVILAQDGREALDKFLENQDVISLVILDLTLPDLSGDQVFKRLREIDPKLPVIISSGHGPEVLEPELLKEADKFFPKPYRANELLDVINETLRG